MNKVLHYERGSSDKVYVGSIVDQGNGKYKVICKWGRRGKSMQSQGKGVFNSRSAAESELNMILVGKQKKGYINIESATYTGTLTPSNSWLRGYLEEDNVATAQPAPLATAPSTPQEIEKELSASDREEAKKLARDGKKIASIKVIRTKTNAPLDAARAYYEQILEPEVKSEKSMAPAAGEKDFEVVCVNNLGVEESYDEGVTYVAEPHAEDGYIYVWDRNAVKQEVFAERFEKAKAEAIA